MGEEIDRSKIRYAVIKIDTSFRGTKEVMRHEYKDVVEAIMKHKEVRLENAYDESTYWDIFVEYK